MPVAPTYPGVYIEEIPSGVKTLTGVATSITAFVGRALKGPDNNPIMINSYSDYERTFGGLWEESSMSYAVSDFFMNGGSQAIIVRLFKPDTEDDPKLEAEVNTEVEAIKRKIDSALNKLKADATVDNAKDAVNGITNKYTENTSTKGEVAAAQVFADSVVSSSDVAGVITAINDSLAAAKTAAFNAVKNAADDPTKVSPGTENSYAKITAGGLKLRAATMGAWGNNLRVRIEYAEDSARTKAALKYNLGKDDLFNLIVHDTGSGTTETFLNLTVKDHARRIDRILENESGLVATLSPIPTARPSANDDVPEDTSPWTGLYSHDVSETEKATDGQTLTQNEFTGPGTSAEKKGLYSLEKSDIFNLLCIPPHTLDGDIENSLISKALVYCEKRRAMYLVDPPTAWNTKAKAKLGIPSIEKSKNGAIYFPRLNKPNPLRENQMESFAPCGAIAGIFARTDSNRGIWKAPAGLDATLKGVPALSVPLTDMENGELNPLGINCLRVKPAAGRIVWGARTLEGDDRLGSEWKYIPVRRLALYIEESLYRGTQWVVFEPNDEPLWSQIRLNLGAFMHNLFRQGAFQGKMPADAYFVKCDKESTTQNDINLGIVNIIVGFAPLKPAEFVIIKIQQKAGQIAS